MGLFLSADVIHHLTLTDVASGWTHKTGLYKFERPAALVVEAVHDIPEELSVPLARISTPITAGQFINEELLGHCTGAITSPSRGTRSVQKK